MRAREADESGYATSADGLRLYWEGHGSGAVTIVLLPANPISNSRLWKAQVHYLARHYRVILYDGRGNGKSDNPDTTKRWLGAWRTDDCLAVMDATATRSAVLAGICGDGVWASVQLAAAYPERVDAIVAIGTGVALLSPRTSFAPRRCAPSRTTRARTRRAGRSSTTDTSRTTTPGSSSSSSAAHASCEWRAAGTCRTPGARCSSTR